MLVSVTVGVLLVPRFGAAGAAVAVLAASTVYSLLQYAGVVRWAAKLRIGPDVLRLTAATAVALVGLWASAWAGPIVATLLALGLYGVGIAVLGLVPVGELRRRLGWRAAGPPGRERVAL